MFKIRDVQLLILGILWFLGFLWYWGVCVFCLSSTFSAPSWITTCTSWVYHFCLKNSLTHAKDIAQSFDEWIIKPVWAKNKNRVLDSLLTFWWCLHDTLWIIHVILYCIILLFILKPLCPAITFCLLKALDIIEYKFSFWRYHCIFVWHFSVLPSLIKR